jgi:hypothetical protein
VGELAKGHGVEGRGVEPIDDERAVAAHPFEAFAGRAFRGCLGRIKNERRSLAIPSRPGRSEKPAQGRPFADERRIAGFDPKRTEAVTRLSSMW